MAYLGACGHFLFRQFRVIHINMQRQFTCQRFTSNGKRRRVAADNGCKSTLHRISYRKIRGGCRCRRVLHRVRTAKSYKFLVIREPCGCGDSSGGGINGNKSCNNIVACRPVDKIVFGAPRTRLRIPRLYIGLRHFTHHSGCLRIQLHDSTEIVYGIDVSAGIGA